MKTPYIIWSWLFNILTIAIAYRIAWSLIFLALSNTIIHIYVMYVALCKNVITVWLATSWWFSPVSFTNKTDRHDITEILLKVPLNHKPNQIWDDMTTDIKLMFNLLLLQVISLAKLLRMAMSLPDVGLMMGKRNAGTVDTLYNIPDLFEEGR